MILVRSRSFLSLEQKNHHPVFNKNQVMIWRSGWDSNPRRVAPQLISSQSRYDHFDTAPCATPIIIGGSFQPVKRRKHFFNNCGTSGRFSRSFPRMNESGLFLHKRRACVLEKLCPA